MLREPTEEEYLELVLTDWFEEAKEEVKADLGVGCDVNVKIRDNAENMLSVNLNGKDVYVCIMAEDPKYYQDYFVVASERFEYELDNLEKSWFLKGRNPIFEHNNIKAWK